MQLCSAVRVSKFSFVFSTASVTVLKCPLVISADMLASRWQPVAQPQAGRHAFSVDGGDTWDYSTLDAYNGTVEYTDGTIEDYYLRARPHLLLDDRGQIIALSNGLRPTKASEYVFTLVQPVAHD